MSHPSRRPGREDIKAKNRKTGPVPGFFAGFFADAAAIWVWRSSEGFDVGSLDVLILLAVLVAPSLRGLVFADFGLMALQAAILFYSIEILMHAPGRRWDWLRVASLMGLVVLAVRGLVRLLSDRCE